MLFFNKEIFYLIDIYLIYLTENSLFNITQNFGNAINKYGC